MKNIIGKVLRAFADELAEFQQFVVRFMNESIPGLSNELLPEWEKDLGLPDECSTEIGTLIERQTAAHAKHTVFYSGQNKSFYIEYAEALGFTISIQETFGGQAFFRVDISRVDRTQELGIDGARLYGSASAFQWRVTILTPGLVSIEYLKCRFEQLKPAHTFIKYTDLT